MLLLLSRVALICANSLRTGEPHGGRGWLWNCRVKVPGLVCWFNLYKRDIRDKKTSKLNLPSQVDIDVSALIFCADLLLRYWRTLWLQPNDDDATFHSRANCPFIVYFYNSKLELICDRFSIEAAIPGQFNRSNRNVRMLRTNPVFTCGIPLNK